MSPPVAFYVSETDPLVDPELMLRALVRAGRRVGMQTYTVVNGEGGYNVRTDVDVEQAAIAQALREILAETPGGSA